MYYMYCKYTCAIGLASFPSPLLERVLRATFDPRGLASTSRAGESLGTRLQLAYIYNIKFRMVRHRLFQKDVQGRLVPIMLA